MADFTFKQGASKWEISFVGPLLKCKKEYGTKKSIKYAGKIWYNNSKKKAEHRSAIAIRVILFAIY